MLSSLLALITGSGSITLAVGFPRRRAASESPTPGLRPGPGPGPARRRTHHRPQEV